MIVEDLIRSYELIKSNVSNDTYERMELKQDLKAVLSLFTMYTPFTVQHPQVYNT